jgi:paraquat-inducible protein A
LIVLCPDCGGAQSLPALAPLHSAVCHRCGAELARAAEARIDSLLAATTTALFLYFPATFLPILVVEYNSQIRENIVATGAMSLIQQNYWSLAAAVFLLTVVTPLVWLVTSLVVLLTLRGDRRPPWLGPLLRLSEALRAWAMPEIMLLGGFVAYSRVKVMATTSIGIGGWAYLFYAASVLAIDLLHDGQALWEKVRPTPSVTRIEGAFACHTCRYPLEPDPASTKRKIVCPRCRTRSAARKEDAFNQCAALVATAAILYIPANLLPVMTTVEFGDREQNTIISGIGELWSDGIWPLAIIVFIASLAVPLLKLLGLSWCLAMISRRSASQLVARTHLVRLISFIGRWSNIDVFTISILCVLGDFGNLEKVEVDPGAIAFAAVVILTMIATHRLDSRLMWDAAEPEGEPRVVAS